MLLCIVIPALTIVHSLPQELRVEVVANQLERDLSHLRVSEIDQLTLHICDNLLLGCMILL